MYLSAFWEQLGKATYVQLELPATKAPSEFSHPHSPLLGSLMQSVPTPLDVPLSLVEFCVSILFVDIISQNKVGCMSSSMHCLRTNSPPEESPAVRVSFHLGRCRSSASVSAAGTIWCALDVIILVVRNKNGKGLRRRGASVVRAFSRLDGIGGSGCY